ncbi:hypothetical protein BH23CHL8_BH23CHL8_07440 [soil metagenome]
MGPLGLAAIEGPLGYDPRTPKRKDRPTCLTQTSPTARS